MWNLCLTMFLYLIRSYVCAHSRILGYGRPRVFRMSETSLLSDEMYWFLFSTLIGTTSKQFRPFLMLSIVLLVRFSMIPKSRRGNTHKKMYCFSQFRTIHEKNYETVLAVLPPFRPFIFLSPLNILALSILDSPCDTAYASGSSAMNVSGALSMIWSF